MQNARLDLLGLAEVPEIFAEITARAARHVHLFVIFVVAVGTFPLIVVVDDDLPVVAADVAIIALGIEFGILDVVVNISDDFFHGFEVVLHIGDLDVGNAAARRDGLELAFEREFGKSVDILAHVHVIGIGIIPLVRHVGYGAEFFLVDARKTVAERFRGRSVQRKSQSRRLFPWRPSCRAYAA